MKSQILMSIKFNRKDTKRIKEQHNDKYFAVPLSLMTELEATESQSPETSSCAFGAFVVKDFGHSRHAGSTRQYKAFKYSVSGIAGCMG